jgi:hypothetical protein
MRLFCLALVQRLPVEALNDAAVCLSGLYDFQSCLSWERGALPGSKPLAIGINGLIRKRIDAIAQGGYTEAAASSLQNLRDQLADSLEYAEQGMGILAERLELGDMALPDHGAVRRPMVAAHRVPDDTTFACDPDERIK